MASTQKSSILKYADTQDSATSIEVDDDDHEDTRCDFYFCAPLWCQKLRTKPIMIACLSWCIFTKSILTTGFVKGSLTSLERRYGLTSIESSAIIVFYNFGVIVCLIPVCKYANKVRKLRAYSGGIFIMGIGAFLFSLPHFTGGAYKYQSMSRQPVCYREESVSMSDYCELDAERKRSHQRSFRFMFWLCGLIMGVGVSPLHIYCTTYIDDNTKVTESPLYLGIFYSFSVAGPCVGYLLSAYFLESLFVDAWSPHPGLTNADTHCWIGAWWIGPLIAGVMSLIVIPALFSFPSELPGRKRNDAGRPSEAFSQTESLCSTISHRDVCKNIRILMNNPTFLFLSFAIMAFDFQTTSLSTFGPKYMETIFGYSPAEALKTFGTSIVFVGAIGSMVGGGVTYYLRMTLLQTLRCMAFLSLIIPPLLAFTFLVPCGALRETDWAGLTSPYQNGSTERSLNSSCNFDCQCSQNYLLFSPVCGKNGLTYFSPCYAGCSSDLEDKHKYTNCSCIPQEDDAVQDYYIRRGACAKRCMNTFLFMVLFCVTTFHLFLLSSPSLTATLRSVPAKQKSMALGFQWMIIRIVGSITGPLITGTAFDYTCNYWSHGCNSKGNCYIYDQTRLRAILLCIFGVAQTFMSVSLFLAWNYYKSDFIEEHLCAKDEHTKGVVYSLSGASTDATRSSLPIIEKDGVQPLLKVPSFSFDGTF